MTVPAGAAFSQLSLAPIISIVDNDGKRRDNGNFIDSPGATSQITAEVNAGGKS